MRASEIYTFRVRWFGGTVEVQRIACAPASAAATPATFILCRLVSRTTSGARRTTSMRFYVHSCNRYASLDVCVILYPSHRLALAHTASSLGWFLPKRKSGKTHLLKRCVASYKV